MSIVIEGFEVDVSTLTATTTAVSAAGNGSVGMQGLELVGDDADNPLTGGDGPDTLRGLGGNDVLDGGAGADTLIGGKGSDVYMLDTPADVVIEQAGSLGGEHDTIHLQFTPATPYLVPEGVEEVKLDVSGDGANIQIIGNDSDNWLHGGKGNDLLQGGDGNDTLDGGDGVDQLQGGLGDDRILTYYKFATVDGGPGVDTLVLASSIQSCTFGLDSGGNGLFSMPNPWGTCVIQAAGVELVEFQNGTITWAELLASTGDAGSNVIHGNERANLLSGGAGDDALDGQGGDDRLTGGAGVDQLLGGAGDDWLVADSGDDTVDGGTGDDTLVLPGLIGDWAFHVDDSGIWTFQHVLGDGQLVHASHIEAVNFSDTSSRGDRWPTSVLMNTGSAGDDVIHGSSSAANSLYGGAGNDTLYGGGGDDQLDGGTGVDTLIGGAGNDTYEVDNPGDMVVEFGGVEGGTKDTVNVRFASNGRYVLPVGVEDAIGTFSKGNLVLVGNASNNRLVGGKGSGDDTLLGGDGDDWLLVPAGNDMVDGGPGNDTLQLPGNWTQWMQSYDAATGWTFVAIPGAPNAQTVHASHIESVQFDNLLATMAEVAQGPTPGGETRVGDDTDNVLQAGAGRDTLQGLAGNDILIGGVGADRMEGGPGDDQYWLTRDDDQVVESPDASGGRDTVHLQFFTGTYAHYMLPSGVENAEVGDGRSDGFTSLAGNELDNRLVGGKGGDTLFGAQGNDELHGGKGFDALYGGEGDDVLFPGDGADVLYGSTGADRFVIDSLGEPDTVMDFEHGVDKICLPSALFGALGQTPKVDNVYLSYNADTGTLSYDPDGPGTEPAQPILLLGFIPNGSLEGDIVLWG